MIKKTLKSNKYFNFIYRRIFFPNLSQPEKDIYYLRKLNFDYSLDIGANVGTYSIELSKISKKVIAFEPIKKIFKCTKEYLPKNVILNNFALGNCTKKQKIFTPLQKNSNAEYALSSIKNILAACAFNLFIITSKAVCKVSFKSKEVANS